MTLILNQQELMEASCCVGYSSRHVPCHKLKRYTIQRMTGTCDINAVIFHTRSGRFICANPSLELTVNILQCLKVAQVGE
uniref:Chemokine interleukin-8-like domain-containing protein n=1 Tax=Paramormyrops kingsleyae TaxID=1676925 RepID=A0A3B3Q855_9TELE